MRTGDLDVRRQAFGDVIEGYWRPVYTHFRLTWHMPADDARDATQGFFADVLEKSRLDRFEPAKARFRTFMRVAADGFVQKQRESASRLKRGGAVSLVSFDPLPCQEAERTVLARLASSLPDPETLFHQEFVRALFERAVDAVRLEYSTATGRVPLQLFERYDLAPDDCGSYADLAGEFGLTVPQVTNALAQVRRRFRQHALAGLRAVACSHDEFRREARELFGIDVE